jgi:hypothetical protein
MKTLTHFAKIKVFFPFHSGKMVKNLLILVGCIIQSRTVCLYKCRDKVPQMKKGKQTKMESDYQRLIRFFKMGNIRSFIEGIQQMLIAMIGVESIYWIMDRSNWKVGRKNVNLLTIGGLYWNVFIPLSWIQLNKRGNSNLSDRKKVIRKMKKLWLWTGKKIQDVIVLGDREFIGSEWFEFLLSEKLSFVVRLKENRLFELKEEISKKNFNQILAQAGSQKWNIFFYGIGQCNHVYDSNC